MDPRFQTSFIPKKPIAGESQSRVKTINLFVLISTVIFVASIATAVGAFLYERVVASQIEQDKETLNRAREAFDPELIRKIVRLDERIETSQGLLTNHIGVSNLFDLLEKITLKTVRFKEFSLEHLAKDKTTLSMKGIAQGFVAVALQSDKFSADPLFKNTIVGDIALEPNGSVSFSVITSIDSAVISYAANLPKLNSQPVVPNQTASTTPDGINF
jgi:hypothetical protein